MQALNICMLHSFISIQP